MQEDEFKCIKAIKGEEYYNKWLGIKNVYQPFLDEGAYRSDIKYMTHSYSKHCINIYENIDMLIEWGGVLEPNKKETFLLDVSVILHDIYMAISPEKRNIHSQEAYEFILNQIRSNKRNVINSFLTANEAEMVADIVLGHSDLKYEGKRESTLEYLWKKYDDETDVEYSKARIVHLAAILRIADELDATRNRITRPYEEMNFNLEDENDKESSIHYRKLKLVKKISPNKKKNDELLISIDDDVFGVENNEDIDYILEVKDKIQEELNNINEIYARYQQQYLCPSKRFLRVCIKSNCAERAEEIEDYEKKRSKRSYNYSVADKELEKEITDAVLDNGLLISGHYKVNEEICSRDWIDTSRLIEDTNIFEKIINFFQGKIVDVIKEENIIILGIGDVGLRLGTILAYKFNLPFLHIIPEHIKDYYDEHETNKIEIKEQSKFLLVTDVIVTGKSLETVCKKYEVDLSAVLGIYSIFLRDCNLELENNSGILSKIIAINNEFDAELIRTEGCKLRTKHGKCICNNKIIT